MRRLAGLGRRLGVVLGYCAPKPRVNMRANSSGAVWCGAAYVSSAPQKYSIPVCSVCGRAVGWTAGLFGSFTIIYFDVTKSCRTVTFLTTLAVFEQKKKKKKKL